MINIDDLALDAKTIAISGHIRPDGDCIGSCLAMYLYLTKSYPDKKVDVFLQTIPPEYKILKGVDAVKTDFKTDVESYDLFIVLDCGKERIGDAESFFDKAKKTANIDHHISNLGTGDENYIVPTASSACELVYDVLDKEMMDESIAKALYTGIITDTGVFKYSNTSPKTMKTGAELISYGFDFGTIIDSIFYEKTYVQNQILGRTLLESTLLMGGHCIYAAVNKQTMDFYKAANSDLEGIVSQLMLTKGVDCAVFASEMGSLEYKVSLRSNGNVNVASIAEMFGGGGHARAAGCTMNGTSYDVINNLSQFIEQQLIENGIINK